MFKPTSHKLPFGAFFQPNLTNSALNPKLLKEKWIETQFIGVRREMKRSETTVRAIACSSAAYREYNNIIFRF